MKGAGNQFWVLLGVACYALLVVVPASEAQSLGAGIKYQIIIDCPQTTKPGVAGTLPGSKCPVQATDPQDEMGSPSVAVDPLRPERLIMASLHGSDGNGPTERSRHNGRDGVNSGFIGLTGMPFTTFTSKDAGLSWTDKPFFAPSDLARNYKQTFGEHAQATIDPYRHVYIGSLYSMDDGKTIKGTQKWKYVIASQKFLNLDSINGNQNGAYNQCYIDPMYTGNTIPQFWFLYSLSRDNMTIVWNEQTPNWTAEAQTTMAAPPVATLAGASTILAAAGPLDKTNDDPCAQDDSEPVDFGPLADKLGARKARSVIGIAYTSSAVKAGYHQQKAADAIGPCRTSTNPVYSEGRIYIGCAAKPTESPFTYDPTVQNDQLVLFRMWPNGTGVEYLGRSPLNGGEPKLGVRTDGRLALASANSTVNGDLSLVAAYGTYNNQTKLVQWSPVYNYGPKVSPPSLSIDITEANVQDIIYREQSGVIHMVLKERIKPKGIGVDSALAVKEAHFRKYIVALDERYGFLTKLDLDVGNLRNRTDPVLLQAPEENYNDLSDDFVQLPPGIAVYNYLDRAGVTHKLPIGYQREFFAVGDYGIVQFSELIELTNIVAPGLPNPYVPPPPIPNPAVALSVTAVVIPSAGISVAATLTALMFANKRKELVVVKAKGD